MFFMWASDAQNQTSLSKLAQGQDYTFLNYCWQQIEMSGFRTNDLSALGAALHSAEQQARPPLPKDRAACCDDLSETRSVRLPLAERKPLVELDAPIEQKKHREAERDARECLTQWVVLLDRHHVLRRCCQNNRIESAKRLLKDS